MTSIRIFDLIGKKALVTRDSANVLREFLRTHIHENVVKLDFDGIDAVTPSFVDEVLAVIDETFRTRGHSEFRVQFLNPPTRLSSKFLAIGKGRGLDVQEAEDHSWTLTTTGAAPAPT
jgi:hypothetical protein